MNFKLAFVTGATSGIGKAICEWIAKKGISLLITGRDEERLTTLARNLSNLVDVRFYPANLDQSQERERLFKVIHENVPDLVINCAGFGLYGDSLTYTTGEQSDILEVNAKAVLELSLETARTLLSNKKRGVVMNVSSAASFQVFPGLAVYAASKAFVNSFSQALDEEVKAHGVRILTACPGMVSTDFQKRAGENEKSLHHGMMEPSFVAREIWKQILNLQPLLIIDWKVRLLTNLSTLIPKQWISSYLKKKIKNRIHTRELIKVKNEHS